MRIAKKTEHMSWSQILDHFLIHRKKFTINRFKFILKTFRNTHSTGCDSNCWLSCELPSTVSALNLLLSLSRSLHEGIYKYKTNKQTFQFLICFFFLSLSTKKFHGRNFCMKFFNKKNLYIKDILNQQRRFMKNCREIFLWLFLFKKLQNLQFRSRVT